LHNALAASACAYALGVSITEIVQGLASFQGVAGRAVFRPGLKQATIIDDTYNANLSSSLTAIEVLASCQGRRILVFGDMAELGSHSPAHHRAVGLAAKQHGIETVMTVGVDSYQTTEAFAADGHHFDTQHELVTALLHQLDSHTTILVKGSRSSAMEKIVQQLVIS
jgi:UDP-N-acetylmuramoyl-tripeptide--D-alanyl-D-alanine ligase